MTLPFDPIAEARRQWRARGWGEDVAMAAVTSIFRAQQILLARITEVLRPMDLTFARYEVLALLTVSRRGALPLGRIGERLQVSPASVTNAIDRLAKDGLVRRDPHPTDGRTTLAVLTEDGRELLVRATRALEEIRYGAEGLDDEGAGTVLEALGPLRASAGDVAAEKLGRPSSHWVGKGRGRSAGPSAGSSDQAP